MIRDWLTMEHYNLEIISEGREALERMKFYQFDLIILDWELPGMNGLELQQEIAHEIARQKVGRELKLLVDQPLIARTEADAPDIDTRVILSEPALVGQFVRRRITGSRGYDLLA